MKQRSESGFGHLAIITAMLAVALVGALGYIFYQNFIQTKSSSSVSSIKTNDDSKTKTKTETGNNSNTDPNKGYLVLSDWGVKFKLPADLGDNTINYYKSDGYGMPVGVGSSYAFTTRDQEALAGYCSNNAGSHFMPIGYLGRQTSPQSRDAVSGGVLVGKIDNYYYYFTGSQAPCSEQDKNADGNMIESFLKGIEKE